MLLLASTAGVPAAAAAPRSDLRLRVTSSVSRSTPRSMSRATLPAGRIWCAQVVVQCRAMGTQLLASSLISHSSPARHKAAPSVRSVIAPGFVPQTHGSPYFHGLLSDPIALAGVGTGLNVFYFHGRRLLARTNVFASPARPPPSPTNVSQPRCSSLGANAIPSPGSDHLSGSSRA